jgi:hypothetical protein
MNDSPLVLDLESPSGACFPLAASYHQILPHARSSVREPEPVLDPFTERHLHCVWYDDRLRPEGLVTARGEALRILHCGRWNQESGPDFMGGEWEVGGRRVCGDIEIHIRPMDWKLHGHAEDPRYGNVRLHVTYEPGRLPSELLPAACEEVSLKAALDARSHFFFDSIDTSAYPWEVEGGQNELRNLCASMDEPDRGRLLDAAGQERLRRKTLRMARAMQAVGPSQALYQAMLRGLGYKQNADIAEESARRLPLHELRHLAQGDPETAHALLLGVAGLLPADNDSPGIWPWMNPRALWGDWFRHRDTFAGALLQPENWRLDHCRPDNHPRRRIRAAAAWFVEGPAIEEDLLPHPGESAKGWVKRALRRLEVREPGEAPGEGRRLVGPERAAAIVVNALLPWRACLDPGSISERLLKELPAEALNAPSRSAAHVLFGPDHHPRLYRNTLRRQGLLQFHDDFGC